MPTDGTISIKSHLLAALAGMLAAQFAWAVCLFEALVWPGPIFTTIACPITSLGHRIFWPYESAPKSLAWWVDSDTSMYIFGLCFYGLIGALVGASISRRPIWRFSLRTLLIATTLIAVVLGLGICTASK